MYFLETEIQEETIVYIQIKENINYMHISKKQ
jgi:hypothetical protein